MSDFLPGLSEALHAARTNKGGGDPIHRQPNCTVCIVIRHAVAGEARESLIAASAGRISGKALRASLRGLGIIISREAIFNHRNEDHRP